MSDNITPSPASAPLAQSQLAQLAELGQERTAAKGESLYRVGDQEFPFVVILEGEVAIVDAAGVQIAHYGASNFLGEMSLLTGRAAFITAQAVEPVRYIAIDREVLRALLFEDSPLSDLVLGAFITRREALQREPNVGLEIVGPQSSAATMAIIEFARANQLPFAWRDPRHDEEARRVVAESDRTSLPLVRLPGGVVLAGPSPAELSRALGVGRELTARESVDLLVIGAGPAGLGSAVYGASEGLSTLVVESTALGGQAGSSRRIENYLGFPAGISGAELTSRAVAQARKFNARTATPYRAISLTRAEAGYLVELSEGTEVSATSVILATGAEYRRLPLERLSEFEGTSIFYTAGPPEAVLCSASRVGVVGGGNSAGQAAVWLARGGALVTLFHRRQSLAETMSDYLIRQLEEQQVVVRDRSELTNLHGQGGELAAITLVGGEQIRLSFLFLFLGASPCTKWLEGSLALDDDGFVLTGTAAGTGNLLETSLPGVFAAGDVRSGSVKRCATAVGEGATAVQFVHALRAADATTGTTAP